MEGEQTANGLVIVTFGILTNTVKLVVVTHPLEFVLLTVYVVVVVGVTVTDVPDVIPGFQI